MFDVIVGHGFVNLVFDLLLLTMPFAMCFTLYAALKSRRGSWYSYRRWSRSTRRAFTFGFTCTMVTSLLLLILGYFHSSTELSQVGGIIMLTAFLVYLVIMIV